MKINMEEFGNLTVKEVLGLLKSKKIMIITEKNLANSEKKVLNAVRKFVDNEDTLKLNTFIATLQFVDCICRFAKTMKLSDIYTVDWSDLFSGKESEYPELMEYLKSKNLI